MRKTPCVPGMLGTEVQENEIRAVPFTAHAPFFRTEAQRLLLGHFFLVRQLIGPHLRRASRMLFAQRVTDPGLRHQNPFKVRVTVKSDAEHVPHFALVPIGCRPDARDTRQRNLVLRKGYLDTQIFVSIEGQKMIDNGEITRRRPIAMRFHPFIDGGEVVQHLVRPIYFFFEEAKQCRDAISVQPKRGYVVVRLLRDGSRTEPVGDFLRDGRDVDHTSSGSLSTAGFLPRRPHQVAHGR